MNKLFTTFLVLGVLCSGIWCASYVASAHPGCHADNLFSVMCVETLEHGSIISGAMLVVFSVAVFCAALFIFRWFIVSFVSYTALVQSRLKQNLHFDKKPTRLQILFARGILHPRNP